MCRMDTRSSLHTSRGSLQSKSMGDEDLSVQLQILSTAVKIYISNPEGFMEQLSALFRTASENTDNPDLRDRAFIYWRLLNLNDLELAKEIVMGEKPQTQDEESNGPVSADLAAILIPQLGLVTSVLWETEAKLGIEVPETDGTGETEMTDKGEQAASHAHPKKKEVIEQREIDQEDLLGLGLEVTAGASTATIPASSPIHQAGFSDNLLDIGIGDEVVSPVHTKHAQPNFIDLTGSAVNNRVQSINPPLEVNPI